MGSHKVAKPGKHEPQDQLEQLEHLKDLYEFIHQQTQTNPDMEQMVRAVEVMSDVALKKGLSRFARWVFALTLGASFLLLTLHSVDLIKLPSVAIHTVSYTIPAAVIGVILTVIRDLFPRGWKKQ